ncbi:hypothetical protein [Hymenobacter arizonensis]|uniref:hypothetical protein n=1 Tax=Hymenobacter arizonensis TaxID=1227077 RepID=UPI000B8239FA|nr:hypothetical protein [Hymenobacter arizonensis]
MGEDVPIGGGMGRLRVQGVACYRKKLAVSAADAGKTIYLDIDGAMSYAMVWLNGQLVGGWLRLRFLARRPHALPQARCE